MFLGTEIFAGIRARNRSRKPITIFFKITFAKDSLKEYGPLWYIISLITIKSTFPLDILLSYDCFGFTMLMSFMK